MTYQTNSSPKYAAQFPERAPMAFQGIETAYLGPTDTKPSRVKARSSSGLSVTISWDSALNQLDNHARAAAALAVKYGWRGGYYAAANSKSGYMFAHADAPAFTVTEG